jgi:hypothetical protein
MDFVWLNTTRKSFDNIWSRHFSGNETIEYKFISD